MDNDNGFYMVKFDQAADKEKVITKGPWLIFDHCLAVTHWSPELASPNAKVNKTIVWVRFPGLNLVYYDESFLLAMASAFGRPIKVDTNTLKIERGKFARVRVEIDLTMPVVGKIWVDGHWYKVQYEGLHLICTCCGCYGHLGRNCPTTPVKTNTTEPPPQNATVNHQGDNSQIQQPGPTATKEHLITGSQNGKAVTNFSQESSAHNDKIISIGEGDNELHGDWLLVTRRKKIPTNPTSNSLKTVNHKANRFNALNSLTQKNKLGPSNHLTQPHPNPTNLTRAPQIPKETKRRRHDDLINNEPILEYSHAHTPMSSVPKHKAHIKTAYVAKNTPQIPNSRKAIHYDFHKHAPLESIFPSHDNNYPTQAELETNNSIKTLSCDTSEDVHKDAIVMPENHDSQDTNEEDMVT